MFGRGLHLSMAISRGTTDIIVLISIVQLAHEESGTLDKKGSNYHFQILG